MFTSLTTTLRFKTSLTNWAAGRGLIDPCKGQHGACSHSQAPTKPSSVVLARKEQRKVVEPLVEEEEGVREVEVEAVDVEKEGNVTEVQVVVENSEDNEEEVSPSNEETAVESTTAEGEVEVVANETEITLVGSIEREIEAVQLSATLDLKETESCTELVGEQDTATEGKVNELVVDEEVVEKDMVEEVVIELAPQAELISEEVKTDLEPEKEKKVEEVTAEEEEESGCAQEACLVHTVEVTDTSEPTEEAVDPEATETVVDELELVGESGGEAASSAVSQEAATSIVETVLGRVFPLLTSHPAHLEDLEEFVPGALGHWEEEDTWEDYDVDLNFEHFKGYADFEIGVWNSALWTSEVRYEKPPLEEEVVGWGAPTDSLRVRAQTCGSWSSSSVEGEGPRKDTFDESDFCDSPINEADDSVSTDEGIFATDDEETEGKAVEKQKVVTSEEKLEVVAAT